MRHAPVAALVALGLAVPLSGENASEAPKPQKEHEWLKQFVGEWEAESEGVAAPGQPAMKCKGRMKARMLGGFWVVKEIQTESTGGAVTAVQTIGYDAAAKRYVGTWIDSALPHLWKYTGSVDRGGKVLTLEAEGPNFLKDGAPARFRDSYEFRSKDEILATSSLLGDDGRWTTFMTGRLRRAR